MATGWFSGKCERTGKHVDFPGECVYVLPTIARPPSDVLAMFVNQTIDQVQDSCSNASLSYFTISTLFLLSLASLNTFLT